MKRNLILFPLVLIISPFFINAIEPEIVNLPNPTSIAETISVFGNPIIWEKEIRKNQHNPAVDDTIHYLFYKDKYIWIWQVANDPNWIFLEISITSPEYNFDNGICVGSRLDRMLALMGKPFNISNNIYTYHFKKYRYYIEIDRGKFISRITRSFYME